MPGPYAACSGWTADRVTLAATLRVGTRRSRLALAQTAIVVDALHARGAVCEMVPTWTHGDEISARKPEGGWVDSDGQFTGELERALLDRRVDLVVHSFKDLPIAPRDGLVIAAVLARADARDCLVTRDGGGLAELPFGARIGTSSPRRAAQLAAARPDVVAVPIRGNVDTRLERLAQGRYDALLLAAAGLDRLGIAVPERARLSFDLVLPAPAQGALAVQARVDDVFVRDLLEALDDRATRIAVEAERALLQRIGGGCLAPLGALGEVRGDRLRLRAVLEDASGVRHAGDVTGGAARADAVVDAVAGQLVAA